MMVTAGVDAARNFDLQRADLVLAISAAEALGKVLRDRDRTGIGQGTIIEAGARDDVRSQADVGVGETDFHQFLIHGKQVRLLYVRQHQILHVGNAQLAKAVLVREVGFSEIVMAP